MNTEEENLDFATIKGLIRYGQALAERPHMERIDLPPTPPPTEDRPRQAEEAMAAIRRFVQNAQAGFSQASTYRSARQILIQQDCGGDELVFYAAWNQLLAQGELSSLFRVPIETAKKPTRRRPVAIVPRHQFGRRSNCSGHRG